MRYRKFFVFICIIVIISVLSIAIVFPLRRNNDVELKSVSIIASDKYYITRNEYYETVLKCIGATEKTFDYYSNISPDAMPICDIFESVTDERGDFSERKYAIIMAAYYMDIFQMRYKFNCEFIEFENAFCGNKYITLKEAVVILESVLENTNGDVILYNKEFNRLYHNAYINGILNKNDIITKIPMNSYLTKDNAEILLSRFINMKRYKYINGYECLIDNDSETMYNEYIIE